jgi:exosome complex RNA-binding protein Csl4
VLDTRRRDLGVVRARACTRCEAGFMTLERIHVERKREG